MPEQDTVQADHVRWVCPHCGAGYELPAGAESPPCGECFVDGQLVTLERERP